MPDENEVVAWRSYVKGSRWARFGTALRDRVWADQDLELVICEDEKGLFRTTTRFEVRGSSAAVESLQADLLTSMKEWNDAG